MRKNYLKLFVDYARKNGVEYTVRGDGRLFDVYCFAGTWHYLKRVPSLKLGSKAAYEWLVKTHEEAK